MFFPITDVPQPYVLEYDRPEKDKAGRWDPRFKRVVPPTIWGIQPSTPKEHTAYVERRNAILRQEHIPEPQRIEGVLEVQDNELGRVIRWVRNCFEPDDYVTDPEAIARAIPQLDGPSRGEIVLASQSMSILQAGAPKNS
jgi:hypothetical protein